jgi:hypothetical protein
MGGFSSTIPSGGGNTQDYDPAKYLSGTPGQSDDGMSGGAAPQTPSADFVQSIGRIGMDLQDKIQTLSSQHPEAADDFKVAAAALKKGMAKILTTNSRAMEPQAPRQV